MSNRFHSKYHRQNHHTYASDTNPDSAHDPIASFSNPFRGDFVLTGGLSAIVPSTSAYAAVFTGGNVGIGTNTPNKPLTVSGDVSATGSIFVGGSLNVAGSLSYIDTQVTIASAMSVVNNGTGPALTVTQTGNQPIVEFFDDTNYSAFKVDGTSTAPGYVGISNSNPETRLDIRTVGTGKEGIQIKSLDTSGFIAIRPNMNAGNDNSAVSLNETGIIYSGGLINTGSFIIAPSSSNTTGFLKLNSSGTVIVGRRLGVSTTNPNEDLTVFGNISSSNNTFTRNLYINNGGRLGIGTISPNSELTVVGGISASGTLVANNLSANFINLIHARPNDGLNPYIFLGETNASAISGFNIGYHENENKLWISNIFTTNSVETTGLVIDQSNRIGVSTTNPNERFTVFGNLSTSNIIYGNSIVSNSLTVTGSISASGTGLTVAGSISASGTLVANNLSANFINLLHTRPNDGLNPYIFLGETNASAISGFNIGYHENENKLWISNIFTTNSVETTGLVIDQSNRIGVSTTNPNERFTVFGNLSTSNIIYGNSIVSNTSVLGSTLSASGNITTSTGNVLGQTLSASGNITTSTGNVLAPTLSASTSILSYGAIGWSGSAVGGTVTQLTDKTTAVTLNRPTGIITLANSTIAPATVSSFTLNNNTIVGTTDFILTSIVGGSNTLGIYNVGAYATGAGTALFYIRNLSTITPYAESVQIKYAILRAPIT